MDTHSSHVSRTVMIVDDELFFRELLRDILQKKGFTVVAEATDGTDAVAKYRSHRPEITIMDIFMADKNGIDATKEIISIDRNAKVLISTAIDFDDNVEFALKAGAKGVISKPFIADEITEAINNVLGDT